MPTLLHIDSSPRCTSVSSRLTAAFVAKWKEQNPGGTIIHHNTSLENFPYLDEATVEAFFTAPAALTSAQKQTLACSDSLVDELLAADVIVLGAPMWNLSIPASLKAWIDLIVRERRTFAFTPRGVAPLVPTDKRVYVFTARGGAYPTGSPFHALDHQEPYLCSILGVIGLTQVEFIHADRQSESPEAAAEGLAHAHTALQSIAD
ncbi:FMN-dependent NADH-azoreductase [Candidatus Sulfotelmatomonas gaucii]|uniref:FMN dependent NADH:quinone oxidoreductase n=1 Tax=Candidatus Sulfuritelmatomonas gaucii TaxID=2043161 RepID=A0A2N9LCK3_9BACT|nr:FMN-dependent NADH-azoreductase [Candidatus Sulfotelmatomonas gaucii]